MSDSAPTPPSRAKAWADAHYALLRIPPEERPPSHYRLLGLKPLETNRDLIRQSADRLLQQLRSVTSGPQAEAAKLLLEDVERARSILLSEEKETYDRVLQGSPSAKAAPAPPTKPLPTARPLSAAPNAKPIAVAKPLTNPSPLPVERPAVSPAKLSLETASPALSGGLLSSRWAPLIISASVSLGLVIVIGIGALIVVRSLQRPRPSGANSSAPVSPGAPQNDSRNP